MSEWQEYWDEANEPRKWSEVEMEQKFDVLYESIMLEVREMFYADTKTTYFTYKSKNRYSYKKRFEITDANNTLSKPLSRYSFTKYTTKTTSEANQSHFQYFIISK